MVEIIDSIKAFITPIVNFINSAFTTILPGREEWIVLGIAAFIGYKYKQWNWSAGGWDDMLKGTVVAYIALKILGLGTKIF